MSRTPYAKKILLDVIAERHPGEAICIREIMQEFAVNRRYNRYLPYHPSILSKWVREDKRFTALEKRRRDKKHYGIFYLVKGIAKCVSI